MSVFFNDEEFYKGQVVGMYEQNLYHDSYFYAIVFDGKKVEEIEYDSTAYYSSGRAEVDASEETMNAYHRYLKVTARWESRTRLLNWAEGTGLHYTEIKKIRGVYSGDDFLKCITLLRTKNFRSIFRKSCAEQLRKWLADPEPKYNTPFSRKQLSYL